VSRHRVLVTGAGGFVGGCLAGRLRQDGDCEIFGTSLREGLQVRACDLSNGSEAERQLAEIKPTRIYHCAGSFTNDWETDFAANVLAARNIFEAVISLKLSCRIFLMGSAAEYGWPPPGAVPETTPLRPVSVYGLTKSFQTRLMEYYYHRHGLDVVMARTFNLFGEGCSPSLFPGRVLGQVKKILAGQASRIKVGPLDSRRDYLSVSQAVDAYVRIMERGLTGEIYNVGSGVPVKLSDFLAQLLERHGLTMGVVDISPPVGGDHKGEVTEIHADVSKLDGLA